MNGLQSYFSWLTVLLLFVSLSFCDNNNNIFTNPFQSSYFPGARSEESSSGSFLDEIGGFFTSLVGGASGPGNEYTDRHDLYLTSNVLNDFSNPTGNIQNSPIYQPWFVFDFFKYMFNNLKQGRYIFEDIGRLSTIYDTSIQLGQCLTTSGFVDPDLGKFTIDFSNCDFRSGRLVPGLMCCNPQPPEMLDVKFILGVQGQPDRILNWRDPSHAQYLEPDARVVFIIHGFHEKVSNSEWIFDIRNSYHEKGMNTIVIDWRRGNALQYWQASANVRIIGAMIGKAIMNWNIHDRTLLVGFSLGAQVVGEAGRYTQVNGNVTINECHGLDPAGPFFDGGSLDIRLDKSDCKLVQVIHTSSESVPVLGALTLNLGTSLKSGHCDYWVNCGGKQGPCINGHVLSVIKFFSRMSGKPDGGRVSAWAEEHMCSHFRAPDVYLSSLKRSCQYRAYPCPDCGKRSQVCTDTIHKSYNNTLPPFAECSPDMDDNYFVSSGSEAPYCEVPGY